MTETGTVFVFNEMAHLGCVGGLGGGVTTPLDCVGGYIDFLNEVSFFVCEVRVCAYCLREGKSR